MPIYNPTDANFLTVATARTNNGQKDVRIILEVDTNIFYTLDDDGNLLEIQSSGGGEDLEQTLQNGNFTGLQDIYMTLGTKITGEKDATLYGEGNDRFVKVSSVSDNTSPYIELTAINDLSGEGTTLQQFPEYVTFNVDNIEKYYVDGRTCYFRNENFNLIFPTPGNEYIVKKTMFGGLDDFFTNDNLPTTIGTIEPRMDVVRVTARYSAYEATTNKAYYKEEILAFKKDSVGDYVAIPVAGNTPSYEFTDFSFTTASITPNADTLQVNVTGEGVAMILGWVVEVEYSDK